MAKKRRNRDSSRRGRGPELGGQVLAPPVEEAGFRRTVLADPGGAAFSASQLLLPH
jgi:hypothetical protein